MMLTKPEIARRLRAFLTTPPADRPITVTKFARIADINRATLRNIAESEGMHDATQAALSQALLWLENGQIDGCLRDRKGITIGPAKPPCELVRRIRFDEKGFRLEKTWENPRSFPKR